MSFMFLHPGDLSIWEVLLILTFSALMLFIFVGLPLGLVGYIIYKIVQHRREMSESK